MTEHDAGEIRIDMPDPVAHHIHNATAHLKTVERHSDDNLSFEQRLAAAQAYATIALAEATARQTRPVTIVTLPPDTTPEQMDAFVDTFRRAQGATNG
jgi:hypothetical protein